MFAMNFATMATGTLNFGLFVLPMGDSLGMSRSQFGWAQTTRGLSAGLSSFGIGWFLDRHGPRLLTVAAAAVIGVCVLGLSQARAPWHVMALFGIIGLMGLTGPNSLVTSVPVAKWFRRRRGRALALAAMGLGSGGVAFLPITQTLIDYLDWRQAWIVLAIIFLSTAIPLAALFLRRQPEDMGLTVDGDPTETVAGSAPSQDTAPSEPEAAWQVGEALGTATMWKLMLVFGLAGVAQGGASVHRIPYFVERGFDPQLVSFSFSADAAGAAVMALIAGWAVERVPVRFVAMASYLGFVLAVGLMLDGRNELFLFGSTVVFGLSVGAGMVVHSYIFAAYYGRAFLGAIRGIVTPIILVSTGLGAPLVGYLRDDTGTYVSAWWMLLGIYLASALIVATVVPPQQRLPIPQSTRIVSGQ